MCSETIVYEELRGRSYLVTATGGRFREIARRPEKNLVLVRVNEEMDGYLVLWGGEGKFRQATSEFVSHLKIHGLLRHRGLPQKSVLHTHPTEVIALSHMPEFCSGDALNRMLWSMHPEVKVVLPEGLGFAPYRRPGTEDLADATMAALAGHRVVVWEKHGTVAIGENAIEAFDLIDTVGKGAQVFFLCRSVGAEPKGLDDAQLDDLEDAFGASEPTL
jgi:rhamnulose-1-phosphate aldolase